MLRRSLPDSSLTLIMMIHAVETGEGGLSCQRHGGSVEVSPPKGDKTAPKWSLRGKVV